LTRGTAILDSKRPWENENFLTLLDSRTLGVNGGLEVLVPPAVLESLHIINCHPAFLPFNRGSHHSFWTIMNDTPAGATLHFMVEKIDAGPIIDQMSTKYSLNTSSEMLQNRCNKLCLLLLDKNIKKIMQGEIKDLYKVRGGSIHFKKEISQASTIKANQKIKGRNLLKLIQATKNKQHGFYIEVEGQKFLIQCTISKV
jgi:methionyl-tRNA formyltransferase